MTPAELTKMLRGKKRALSYEEDWKKTELRLLRFIATHIFNQGTSVKSGKRKTAEKLFPFSFDKELKAKINARDSK